VAVIVDAYYEQVYATHDLRIGALRAFVSKHLTHTLDPVRRSTPTAATATIVDGDSDSTICFQPVTACTFDALVYGRSRVSGRAYTHASRTSHTEKHIVNAHCWSMAYRVLHNDARCAHCLRLLSTHSTGRREYGN
jgi:hypothetical protein